MASPTETAITEAAIEYVQFISARSHGSPAQKMIDRSLKDMIAAVEAHAGENDGDLPVSDPDEPIDAWKASILLAALKERHAADEERWHPRRSTIGERANAISPRMRAAMTAAKQAIDLVEKAS